MTAVAPVGASRATTPVMSLHLAPKDHLMATQQRRIRTTTTQHIEEPIAVAPGGLVRGSDVSALISAIVEETRTVENSTEPWLRVDPQTGALSVGYTVTTETQA